LVPLFSDTKGKTPVFHSLRSRKQGEFSEGPKNLTASAQNYATNTNSYLGPS